MEMLGLLSIAYSLGFGLTLIGLTHWRIERTWERAFQTRDPAEFDGLMSAKLFFADIVRAVLWPVFLWRPW